jgi:hypothetical protein
MLDALRPPGRDADVADSAADVPRLGRPGREIKNAADSPTARRRGQLPPVPACLVVSRPVDSTGRRRICTGRTFTSSSGETMPGERAAVTTNRRVLRLEPGTALPPSWLTECPRCRRTKQSAHPSRRCVQISSVPWTDVVLTAVALVVSMCVNRWETRMDAGVRRHPSSSVAAV